MNDVDPYLIPGTNTLANKLGITRASELSRMERLFVAQRIAEGVPHGPFDLGHLRTIHRHLFQDLYLWAGQIRTVELAKAGQQFQFRRYIEAGMADIHRRLTERRFLRGLARDEFANEAANIIGDLNYVHPFREGNGRAQLLYLEQLAEQAGWSVDLTKLGAARWIAACRDAHRGSYKAMADELLAILQV